MLEDSTFSVCDLSGGLFLLRQSATALAEERAFPLGISTLVGGLIVSPGQNQQQEERDGRKPRENNQRSLPSPFRKMPKILVISLHPH